jgi:hypothetical protein
MWDMIAKLEVMRSLGRPRCRWEDNIETDRGYIEWGDMDGFNLAQNRGQCRYLANPIMNVQYLRFPRQ